MLCAAFPLLHMPFSPAKTAFLAAAIAIAFCGAVRAADSGPDADAEALIKAGRLDEAIQLLCSEIQAQPADARAIYDRAYALSIKHDFAHALLDCHAAIQLNPNYAEAYSVMGNVHWMQGQRDEALTDYDEALHLNPKNPDLWYNRALFYMRNDDAKAIVDLTQALSLAPGYQDALYIRGNAWLDQQKYPAAIQDYSDALRINKPTGNVYHQRGFAYLKSGDLPHAVDDFTHAIELKPKSDSEYFCRGYAYSESHVFDRAIADFTQAIALNPKNDGYYDQRGQAYRQLGDETHAAQDFDMAKKVKAGGV
jgi:tetratricopeptide (TPR) repeat protein